MDRSSVREFIRDGVIVAGAVVVSLLGLAVIAAVIYWQARHWGQP